MSRRDELASRAWELLGALGWKAGDNISLHSAAELMVALALQETRQVATHRHIRSAGEYELIGMGRMQCSRRVPAGAEEWVIIDRDGADTADMREVAIYRHVGDRSLWARPKAEFEDGRFEVLGDQPVAPSDHVNDIQSGPTEEMMHWHMLTLQQSVSTDSEIRTIISTVRFATPTEDPALSRARMADLTRLAEMEGEPAVLALVYCGRMKMSEMTR